MMTKILNVAAVFSTILLFVVANSASALTLADITMLQSAGIISASQAANLSVSIISSNYSFTRSLTVGSRGDDVYALQQFLISLGFLKIPTPTSYFGSLTKVALSAYQASVGIYPSVGYFGPISRQRINAINTNVAPPPIYVPLIESTTTTIQITTTSSPNGGVVLNPSGTPAGVDNHPTGLPVRLTIPKLGVDAGFQYNTLTADGAMEVPTNIYDIGWFTSSVHPGERGTSVLTGHVAQIHGGVMTKEGVFYHLNDLRTGDKLNVLNDKGESFTFVVRERISYDSKADATDVFYSNDNGTHLNLITCEGTWNPALLSYSQRLVVFTDLMLTN